MYSFTRYGGVRPLGAALIVVGSDRIGKHLYQLDPRGLILSGKALAIGKNSEDAIQLLKAEYKQDIPQKDALDLAVRALSKAEDGESPIEVGVALGKNFQKNEPGRGKEGIYVALFPPLFFYLSCFADVLVLRFYFDAFRRLYSIPLHVVEYRRLQSI